MPIAERRITSVLFADLVGFTPLSESRDAEEVRELLSQYFEQCRTVIGRYGGTVEKFIGDAVMAVWGVPVAHEDDAERAVRAGLDLVQGIAAMGEDVGAPGLRMRVGVVTGEVAVTVGATAEGMVAGDAVNTASRVQSVAEPGQVWVDDTTRTLSSAAIDYQDAGEHELKGKAQPMRLFAARAVVAAVRGAQRVDGLEAPLTGRAPELRLLKELFHATADSQRPRLVVLDGEAGIGKSRLAWEFEKYIDGLTAQVAWHRGRCLSYGDGVAFWALAEAVRTRLGLEEGESGEVTEERLEAGMQRLVADPAERDWLRPRLEILLGEGGGDFGREDLFSAWSTFLVRAGGGDPVVLVVDDAQYADDGLLDFLDHLLANARGPAFVLALARPELLDRRPELGRRRTSVIRLDPLDETAMAELVDLLVDGLPTSVRDALVERAEGIPLFAVETVRALIDRDLVVASNGRYVAADPSSLDLDTLGAPASLQAIVAARLDALTPAERRVMTDASVLGSSFAREGVVALSGEVPDLDAVLASLQRKEILGLQTDRFSAERGQYRFVQAVVRQVAYATQSKRDRKQRHLAAADYLAAQPDPGDDLAVVIAQHLLDAVDASPAADADIAELTARACTLLRRAATRAQSLGSPAEGQRLLEAALARTDDEVEQARVHLAAADAAADAGDFHGSVQHGQESAALFDAYGMVVDASAAVAAQARSLNILPDHAASIALAEPRWTALRDVPNAERVRLRLARSLAPAYGGLGDFETQARFTDQVLLLAEGLDNPEALAHAYILLGVRYQTTGAPITAAGMYRLAAGMAREHDLPSRLAIALINLSTVQVSRDLPAAISFAREAREVGRRCGVADRIDAATCNYVSALWTAGRLVEARTTLDEGWEAVFDPATIAVYSLLDAWLADAQGTAPSQLPDLESADSESVLAWRGCLDVVRARTVGDVDRAAALAQKTLPHVLAAGGIEDDFMFLWPPLVEAALAADETERAERLLEPVTSAAPGVISPGVRAQLSRLRGLLGVVRGDDPSVVEADLRAGVAALDAFGAVGLCAQAKEELAHWLVEQGRVDEAEATLEVVRATYVDIGADGWLARLDSGESLQLTPRPQEVDA